MRNAGLSEITLPELNGGLNTRDPETGIADNQSPDMLNLWYKNMALCKRPGQMMMSRLADVKRISDPYNGSMAVHAGNRIYRWDGLGAVRYLSEYREEFGFEAGDWFVAAASGTLDGTLYQPGDCMIYNTTESAGQVETAWVATEAGGISAGETPADPWTARVTVAAKDVAGALLSFDVEVAEGDDAAMVAAKIRAALNGSAALSAVCAVGGKDNAATGKSSVTLTRRNPSTKDDLLNIAIENGNCAGLVEAPESEDTPFWHNAIVRADAPKSRGSFDPASGYPLLASPGDCYTARAEGTAGGVAYQEHDIAVYDRQAVSLTVKGAAAKDGSAVVQATAKGQTVESTISLTVGDNATAVAQKVFDALNVKISLTETYAIEQDGADVTLTQLTPADIDPTLKVTLSFGLGSGLESVVSCDASSWHVEQGMEFEETPGVFCEFGDTLYYIQGGEIWQINADYSMNAVEPYIPTVLINTRPDLSESDDGEAYNLIGAGFTVKYNGDANTTLYKLPQTDLDDTDVSATVGITTSPYTATLAEGEGFTVDRSAGTVDFSKGTSPHSSPMAGTDNVWITAYKKVAGAKEKITGCTVAVRFGGESAGVTGGTRVFVMGNPYYPYYLWRSDLGQHVSAGMAYFPDTSEELLDQNSDAITTAAKMGEQLIVFKENSVFAIGYSYDGKDAYYPVRECNSAIGCDMPGSVQLIDNRLVFAHSRSGVHMLVSSDNTLENIVKPISANVNSLLLRESDLKDASSCDFDRYYWLRAGGHVYLWDYDSTPYYNYSDYDKAQKRLAWYRFDNMDATVFCPLENALCYGTPDGIVMLTKSHNDFGQAFTAYFKSKAFDLGSPNELKTFVSLYPGLPTDGNICVTVTASNERNDKYMERTYKELSFDWNEFNWKAFTWHRVKFAQVYEMRLNMRMAAFLQVKMSGGELDRGVGLSSLRVTYYRNRKVKG